MVKKKVNKENSFYYSVFGDFNNDLLILKKLNKELPASIKKTTDIKMDNVFKKINKLSTGEQREMDNFVNEFNKLMEETKTRKKYKKKEDIVYHIPVSKKVEGIVVELISATSYRFQFNTFIREMSLVYLIAEFESFLEDVLTITYNKKPEICIPIQKTIVFEDLMDFEEINDVKQFIIEKEIVSIINQDIEEIHKTINRKFKIDIHNYNQWKQFKERFYRRNLIIHKSGKIDKIYKKKTGYQGEKNKLGVSKRYLTMSLNIYEEMASMITDKFYKKFES